MISVYSIKPQFQRVLTPILELLHRANVTANQITLWACILSLASEFCFGLRAMWGHGSTSACLWDC